MTGIEAVFLDIGETVLDRTAEYRGWAEFLGVPAHTFSAVFGGVIVRGGGVSDVIRIFRPHQSFSRARAEAVESGLLPVLTESDLYPDVRETLTTLRGMGLFVGVVGNQRAAIGPELRDLELPADLVAVSGEWELSKPHPNFFAEVVRQAGCRPGQVVYVGDQLDNDVAAARESGLQAVRVLTGPWDYLMRDAHLEAGCLAVIDALAPLPDVLRAKMG